LEGGEKKKKFMRSSSEKRDVAVQKRLLVSQKGQGRGKGETLSKRASGFSKKR